MSRKSKPQAVGQPQPVASTPKNAEPAAEQPEPPDPTQRMRDWGCYVVYALLLAALAAWSWRKWADGLVDFGLQLYTPWRLAEGSILGRDLIYLPGGPLSQYFHALIFRMFGVSLTALMLTNLGLIALLVGLLHRSFTRAADRLTAVLVCVVTLSVFAFGHLTGIGNYNYVCPYNYEAFHGLLLSVAAIVCLSRWLTTGQDGWALGSGTLLGGVFLTKPDLFLALAVATGTAVLLRFLSRGTAKPPRLRWALFLFLGLVMPSILFLTYFALVGELKAGAETVAGAWIPLLTTGASQNAYYRWCLGLDTPVSHLALMLVCLGALLAWLYLAVEVTTIRQWNLLNGSLFGLMTAGSALAAFKFASLGWGPVLLPATLLGGAFVGRTWWKSRLLPTSHPLVFPLLWSVFALFLLAKMGVHTRLWHYGFYLGMPAAVFLVHSLSWTLPRETRRWGVRTQALQRLIAVCILASALGVAMDSNRAYAAKGTALGAGGDQIFVFGSEISPSGIGVGKAVEWIRANLAPSETLAVLPEGVMINYLARRINPAPYVHLTVAEFAAYGEKRIIDAYAANPPDYIALAHKDSREYGVNFFGSETGFGHQFMLWIRANYAEVWRFGAEPLQTEQFGIAILKRKALRPSPSPSDQSPPPVTPDN